MNIGTWVEIIDQQDAWYGMIGRVEAKRGPKHYLVRITSPYQVAKRVWHLDKLQVVTIL